MFRIRTIAAVLLGAGLLTACGEKDYNSALGVEDEIRRYVYTPVGEQPVSVGAYVIEDQEEATLDFTISYGVTDDKSARIEATVEPDFSLVAAYNTSKSKNLKPFPEANLSFPTKSITIPAGEVTATLPFKIVKLYDLPEDEYLLPVTIKSVNGNGNFPLHETKKTAYYLLTKNMDVILLTGLSSVKIHSVSDEEVTDGGGVGGIFIPDNANKFWHSEYEDKTLPLPHWVIIDMSRTRTIVKLTTERRSNNGDLMAFEWWIKNDNPDDPTGWTQIVSDSWKTNTETPHTKTNDVNPPGTGRYLKLMCTKSNRNPHIGVVYVGIYGK